MASSTKENAVSESANKSQRPAETLAETTKSAFDHFREYGRERPGVLALWCVGIGFVLGWKLKLW